MKRLLVVFGLLCILNLSACSGDGKNEFSGKTFNFAYTPVIGIDIDNPSKYQSFMKVKFSNDNKVSHLIHEEIEGTYQLNENELIIPFENDNEKLNISFIDFKESEKDFSAYAAVISDTESSVKDPSKTEQLRLISDKLNMPLEFIEVKE